MFMENDTVSGGPEVSAATDTQTIIENAAVKVSVRERLKLKRWAWFARRTGAEDTALHPMFIWPRSYKRYQSGFGGYFDEHAAEFGDYISHKAISGRIRKRLEAFSTGSGEPFLIIRRVFSRRYPQRSLTRSLEDDPSYPTRKIAGEEAADLMEIRRYDRVAAALIAGAGAELRQKQPTQHVYHDFITAGATEKNQFADGGDMHLRYRTATPEQPPARSGGAGKAARIVLFACVENPIADPIYLIRADEVVSKLSPEHKKLLRESTFLFFDNWVSAEVRRYRTTDGKHILYDGNSETDPWLSFDPNRFDPTFSKTTAPDLVAVGALMASIQQIAATSARPIVLRRGDALLVDNYRALTRRQEHGYAYIVFKPFMRKRRRPPIRWLRTYYGFPKKN